MPRMGGVGGSGKGELERTYLGGRGASVLCRTGGELGRGGSAQPWISLEHLRVRAVGRGRRGSKMGLECAGVEVVHLGLGAG